MRWWAERQRRSKEKTEAVNDTAIAIAQYLMGNGQRLQHEIFEAVQPKTLSIGWMALLVSTEHLGVLCTAAPIIKEAEREGKRPELTYEDFKYFIPDGGRELPEEIPPSDDGLPLEQEVGAMGISLARELRVTNVVSGKNRGEI